jgi:hypothetical protein
VGASVCVCVHTNIFNRAYNILSSFARAPYIHIYLYVCMYACMYSCTNSNHLYHLLYVYRSMKICETSTCDNVYASYDNYEFPGKVKNGSVPVLFLSVKSFVMVIEVGCQRTPPSSGPSPFYTERTCWGYGVTVTAYLSYTGMYVHAKTHR